MDGARLSLQPAGMDELAAAWLGAGASAVSVWERDQLIRQWPKEASLGSADFVAPVRTSNHDYGEMRITGFSAPGWTRWERCSERISAENGLPSWNGSSQNGYHSAADFADGGQVLRGIELSADSRPALEAGGDYYDFVYQPIGQLAFCVADVSGKGLGAAMRMPGMHSVLRRSLDSAVDTSPHHRLQRASDDIYSLFADTACFATAFLGRYEARTRMVSFSNAGHAPVIYRSATGKSCLLKADSPPLGIQQDANPTTRTIRLAIGDVLVVATDGLAEARSGNGRMFGYQRLLDLVDDFACRSPRALVRLLFERVAAFTQGAVQSDDQTVMVLKGTG